MGSDSKGGVIEVLDPAGEPRRGEYEIAPRLDGLAGKTIGLLDNVKPNADVILNRLGELLTSTCNIRTVTVSRKRGPGVPSTAQALKELVEGCDAVITGLGD